MKDEEGSQPMSTPLDHLRESINELAEAIDQEWSWDDTNLEQFKLLRSAAEDLRLAASKIARVSAIYAKEEFQTSLRFS
jgi:hypothetical protein